MRAMWQDPEWRAHRLERVMESKARGTGNAARAEGMRKVWKDPAQRRARIAGIMEGLKNGNLEKHRATIAKTMADPAVQEKRLRKLREKFATMPLILKARGMALARRRRGFDVPAHLWKEYQFLRNTKCLSAREAGLALGLVRQ